MTIALIRPERPGDIGAIAEVTREAFWPQPYSTHTEQLVIDALRRAGALSVSLVAERAGKLVAHVAFSPVTLSDGSAGWYGLGPLSVTPAVQGQGIGSLLVEHGLAALRACDAQGCVLLGEPRFYGRFGFANDPRLVLDGVPQAYFLALRLAAGGRSEPARVALHAAFDEEA